MCELSHQIYKLIESKQEGAYWDFKQQWYDNNAELVHDIICLANAEYSGQRYLIIGITNPPLCEIVGVQLDSNRKNQAKILDLLSRVPFAGDLRPTISLKTVHSLEKEIDVIIIENVQRKPFTLSKQYSDTTNGPHKSVTLNPGAIYTRVHDKNTPTNSTADLYFVEKMWRERFGLDLTPLTRMQKYLLDPLNWQWDGIDTGYYTLFPEFIIVHGESEKYDSDRWWSTWVGGDPVYIYSEQLKYHATILATKKGLHFSRDEVSIVYPDVDYIQTSIQKYPDAQNTYSFFSYCETTLDYALLAVEIGPYLRKDDAQLGVIKYLRQKGSLHSQTKSCPLGYLPFPIFIDDAEKKDFISVIGEKLPEFFQQHSGYPRKQLGPMMLEEEREFANWAYDLFFDKFRQN